MNGKWYDGVSESYRGTYGGKVQRARNRAEAERTMLVVAFALSCIASFLIGTLVTF